VNRKSRIVLVAAVLAASLAVTTIVLLGGWPALSASDLPASGNDTLRAAAAKTSFPGLAAAAGEPDLAGLQTTRPSQGQILQVPGPFDDRLIFENLAFDGQAATGAVKITSDVSELLELQVLAGFYDGHGALLGTARFEHHAGSEGHNHSGPPEEREEFSIQVPAELKTKAVSAAVGVPVLVNE